MECVQLMQLVSLIRPTFFSLEEVTTFLLTWLPINYKERANGTRAVIPPALTSSNSTSNPTTISHECAAAFSSTPPLEAHEARYWGSLLSLTESNQHCMHSA